MGIYYAVSLILTTLAVVAWMSATLILKLPDLDNGMLLMFAALGVACLMMHSFLLALIVYRRRPSTILSGRYGVRIHLILAAIPCLWIGLAEYA